MDLNMRAFRTVQAATSEQETPTVSLKILSARKGGLIGGPSRAKSISAARRREIARAASDARWHKAKARKE